MPDVISNELDDSNSFVTRHAPLGGLNDNWRASTRCAPNLLNVSWVDQALRDRHHDVPRADLQGGPREHAQAQHFVRLAVPRLLNGPNGVVDRSAHLEDVLLLA